MFMPGFVIRVLLAATLLAVGPAVVRAADSDEETIARARALLKLFLDGKHDEFIAAGDETMRANLTTQQAARIRGAIALQCGEYQAEESAQLNQVGPHNSVQFKLRFERARQPIRVVLDQQGRLSGLWLDAAEPSFTYEPPEYADKSAFREETLSVSAGAYPLPATLTIPKQPGKYPGVVLVHGSGPHDQDETVGANKPFRDLAWGLASRGIAVLRYEKRTKAHPYAKKAGEWTLADATIDDAVAALAVLRTRPEIDTGRIYLLGHSLGGLAAPYIGQRDKQLAGLIILAGAARSILDMILDQNAYLSGLDGIRSLEEQQQIDKVKEFVAAIRDGRLEDVPPDSGVPARFFAELHQLKPAQAAAELGLPILVLQGGRDYQVTRADFRLWQEALKGQESARFTYFEDLNHLLVAGKGASSPDEYQQPGHVDVNVINTIVGWIKRPADEP